MDDMKLIAKNLQIMPNVGPAMADDLVQLGIRRVDDLKGKDPMVLYRQLENISGTKQDPCVLDTFMAIVHFAETGESRKWWSFTQERKKLTQG